VALAIIRLWVERLTSADVSRSDVAAWWGAIVATIAFGWNILRDVRPKGRLKVAAMYQVDSMEPRLPAVLTGQVTNVGSKPVLVRGIAIQRKKRFCTRLPFFPVSNSEMLARGEFFCRCLIELAGSQSLQRGCTRGIPVESTGTWQGKNFVTYSISTVDYHTTLDARKTKAFDDVTRRPA